MGKLAKVNLDPVRGGASRHAAAGGLKGLPDYLAVDLARIKPFHEVLRYGYAVGRIRVLEAQLMSANRLERLLEADFEEALYILNEVAMGDYLEGAKTAGDIDAGLVSFLKDFYARLAEMLPAGSVLKEFFTCRYDFHNLKALLKSRTETGEPRALMPGLGGLDVELLAKGVEEPVLLPPPFAQAARRFVEGQASPQEIDTVVDGEFMAYRLALAKKEGSPFLIDFARASIDLANLKAVIRGRALAKDAEFMRSALVDGGFLPVSSLLDLYGEPEENMLRKLEGSVYYPRVLEASGERAEGGEAFRFTDFDRRSDDYLMEMLRRTKRISVGVEPVFAFVQAREKEVEMVRLILVAKLHNIAPAAIETMLRELYMA